MTDERAIQSFRQDHACGVIRRAALLAAFPLAKAGILKSDDRHGMLASYLGNVKTMELSRHLSAEESTHHNADVPANPYALVYGRRRIEHDFPFFRGARTYKTFMHAPPLPVHRLPSETLIGSHMRAHPEPIAESEQPRPVARAQERG